MRTRRFHAACAPNTRLRTQIAGWGRGVCAKCTVAHAFCNIELIRRCSCSRIVGRCRGSPSSSAFRDSNVLPYGTCMLVGLSCRKAFDEPDSGDVSGAGEPNAKRNETTSSATSATSAIGCTSRRHGCILTVQVVPWVSVHDARENREAGENPALSRNCDWEFCSPKAIGANLRRQTA